MRAARLRNRVTIQNKQQKTSEIGQKIDVWSDEYTVWAAVEPIASSSRYEYINDRFLDQSDHLIIMRWQPSLIDKTKRILFMGQIYAINGWANVGNRNRQLHIFVRVTK